MVCGSHTTITTTTTATAKVTAAVGTEHESIHNAFVYSSTSFIQYDWAARGFERETY